MLSSRQSRFGSDGKRYFFHMEFPYTHLGTNRITADFIFPIVWEAIRQLESIVFKVIFMTADGASTNRKFFRMHEKKI